MKNIESPDKIHLDKLISKLRDGKFVIPDFQREFKWSPADIKSLLISIFEDYYIGNLLLWEASRENQKILSCEPIDGYKERIGEKYNPDYIVLDGQQRLSALFYAFFAPDKPLTGRKTSCLFTVDLEALIKEDFQNAINYEWLTNKVKKILKDREVQYEQNVLPLNIFGEKSKEFYKWLEGYEKYWKEKIGEQKAKEKKDFYEKFFDDMLDSYEIVFIEINRKMEVGKVCDIFTKINSTGINLDIFDLLNALLRPKDILLKEMWREVKSKLNGFEWRNSNIQLLQTMSVLEQSYCSPKYLYYLVPETKKTEIENNHQKKEVVLINSGEEFKEKWKFAEEKIRETIRRLKNPHDYGAIKSGFVPYPTMIPIITALYIEKERGGYDSNIDIEGKIKKWYWSSIFSQSYQSSVESQIAKDFKEMKGWFSDDNSVPKVVEYFENDILNIYLRAEKSSWSAIYKAVFTILVINGARDFQSFDLPEYSLLEDHHIVPRSWGKENKIKEIDSILNRTPISQKTNRDVISNKLPNVYLKEIFNKTKNKEDFYKLMESHLISRKAVDILMKDNFSSNDFEEFIAEREKTIIKRIKSLLSIDESPDVLSTSPDKPYTNIYQIKKVISECEDYIYWIDKYFGKSGLDILAEAFQSENNQVTEINILTSLEKIDESLRSQFKRLKKEMKNKGINVEMRAIKSKKVSSSIHDRWLIGKYQAYNIPSPDVIKRNQYSDITKTEANLPFKEWWSEGLDIIQDWGKVSELKNKQPGELKIF